MTWKNGNNKQTVVGILIGKNGSSLIIITVRMPAASWWKTAAHDESMRAKLLVIQFTEIAGRQGPRSAADVGASSAIWRWWDRVDLWRRSVGSSPRSPGGLVLAFAGDLEGMCTGDDWTETHIAGLVDSCQRVLTCGVPDTLVSVIAIGTWWRGFFFASQKQLQRFRKSFWSFSKCYIILIKYIFILI